MELRIKIIGEIGWHVFADQIRNQIDQANLDQVEKIVLDIDTYGGEVFEAFSIYQAISLTNKPVVANILGKCMSSGTFIACSGVENGGNEILMPKTASTFMVHKAWQIGDGNSDDLKKASETLEKLDEEILKIYKAKTGKSTEYLQALVSEETFMNYDEAFLAGFIDGPNLGDFESIAENSFYKNIVNISKAAKVFGEYNVETQAGQSIVIDADSEDAIIGAAVYQIVDGEREELDNGQYDLAGFFDGKYITVEAGEVVAFADVAEPEPEADPEADSEAEANNYAETMQLLGEIQEEFNKLSEKFDDLKKSQDQKDIKNRVEALEKQFKLVTLGSGQSITSMNSEKSDQNDKTKVTRKDFRKILR